MKRGLKTWMCGYRHVYVHPREPHIHPEEPYIQRKKGSADTHTMKRGLKTWICGQRHVYVHLKEPHIHPKEPCNQRKKSSSDTHSMKRGLKNWICGYRHVYFHPKEPHIHPKEPHKHPTEPCDECPVDTRSRSYETRVGSRSYDFKKNLGQNHGTITNLPPPSLVDTRSRSVDIWKTHIYKHRIKSALDPLILIIALYTLKEQKNCIYTHTTICVHSKEPCIHSKKPYTHSYNETSPIYTQKMKRGLCTLRKWKEVYVPGFCGQQYI